MKPSGSNFTIRAGYGSGPTVQDSDEEAKRRIADVHIDKALKYSAEAGTVQPRVAAGTVRIRHFEIGDTMADSKIACPVEGCDYAGSFRVGSGASDTYHGWMQDEHPNHPHNYSAGPRNVKPKELHLEIELGSDGELNF